MPFQGQASGLLPLTPVFLPPSGHAMHTADQGSPSMTLLTLPCACTWYRQPHHMGTATHALRITMNTNVCALCAAILRLRGAAKCLILYRSHLAHSLCLACKLSRPRPHLLAQIGGHVYLCLPP